MIGLLIGTSTRNVETEAGRCCAGPPEWRGILIAVHGTPSPDDVIDV